MSDFSKKSLVFTLLYLIFAVPIFAQNTEQIVAQFKKIDETVKTQQCEASQLLTYRAMNLFLADRVGYYLSDAENLTFCKNNITLNTGTGGFSMSHSLFEPTGGDLPVKSYNVIGLKANVFNAFQAAANKTSFNNELGFTFKHYWIATPKTTLNNCQEKQVLDAKRAVILKNITLEITNKGIVFENSLHDISEITESTKKEVKADFYKALQEEYARKFAELQYRSLFDSLRYKKLTANWTNVNVYIPVIRQRYTVAENLNTDFKLHKAYPAEISVSHTRFIETHKAAKLYFNFRAGLLLNSVINSKILNWTSTETYLNSGGKYVSYLFDNQIDRTIIGKYSHFITPNIKAQVVFFPPENHFGVSGTIEQNFGVFKATNGTIGIPIVLIDKQSAPMTNLEIQIKYFDLANTFNSTRSLKDNVSISLTWGQPIGRNVY
jgi:hypothetical protein